MATADARGDFSTVGAGTVVVRAEKPAATQRKAWPPMSEALRVASGRGWCSAEFALDLPTPNRREHHLVRAKRTAAQRWVTRRVLMLEAGGRPPPPLPCVVTLTRIGPRLCDSDRACQALAAVRDETARWLHGVPERDARGKVPRAPDGPNDGIEWRYTQERGKVTAARIEIETLDTGATARAECAR